MSYSNDSRTPPQDVAFRPAGVGLTIRARCMGCDPATGKPWERRA